MVAGGVYVYASSLLLLGKKKARGKRKEKESGTESREERGGDGRGRGCVLGKGSGRMLVENLSWIESEKEIWWGSEGRRAGRRLLRRSLS